MKCFKEKHEIQTSVVYYKTSVMWGDRKWHVTHLSEMVDYGKVQDLEV